MGMLFAAIAVALAVQAPAHNTECPENARSRIPEDGTSRTSVSWAGEVSLLQVGALKTHLSVEEREQEITDKYLCTWLATGCPNQGLAPNGGSTWPTMADTEVFNKMHTFCSLTSSGSASQDQRAFCCGADNPACSGKRQCAKQTEWTETCASPAPVGTNPTSPPGEALPTSPDPRFRWEKYESKFFATYAGGDSKVRAFEEAQKRCVELTHDKCGGITCDPPHPYFQSGCTVRYGNKPHDSPAKEVSYEMIPVKEGETPPAATPTEPPASTGPPPTWETHENKVLGDDVAEANTFICQDASKERCPSEEAKERCWQLGPEKCGGITCGNTYFCQLKHGTTLHDAPNGHSTLNDAFTSYVMVPAPSALMSYSKH